MFQAIEAKETPKLPKNKNPSAPPVPPQPHHKTEICSNQGQTNPSPTPPILTRTQKSLPLFMNEAKKSLKARNQDSIKPDCDSFTLLENPQTLPKIRNNEAGVGRTLPKINILPPPSDQHNPVTITTPRPHPENSPTSSPQKQSDAAASTIVPLNFKIQNSGGKSPRNQSDCRKNTTGPSKNLIGWRH